MDRIRFLNDKWRGRTVSVASAGWGTLGQVLSFSKGKSRGPAGGGPARGAKGLNPLRKEPPVENIQDNIVPGAGHEVAMEVGE